MAKKKNSIDESKLTKGELRKLNALRKSIGDELGNEAFSKWYSTQEIIEVVTDPNIEMIEKALAPLTKKLRIPRGSAYRIRRGRGRFIVETDSLKS